MIYRKTERNAVATLKTFLCSQLNSCFLLLVVRWISSFPPPPHPPTPPIQCCYLFFFEDLFIIYFIYFWLHQVLAAVCGIFRCGTGSSLWHMGFLSLVVACGLQGVWAL